jgi:hypothetical protein
MHKKLVVRAIVAEDNSFCLAHDHLVAARRQRGVSSMTMPALTTIVVFAGPTLGVGRVGGRPGPLNIY